MADCIKRFLFPVIVVLAVVPSIAQNKTSHPSGSGTRSNPRVSAEFAKAAVRALVTIETTRQQTLLDAAMIELSAAQSTPAESAVVWHIQLFKDAYGIHEFFGDHSEDQRCLAAWLPKLRGLNPEIPSECPQVVQK